MARLLDWPKRLRIVSWDSLSGPRSVGASSNESITGFVQTVSSVFGGWRWQLTLERMRGRLFRSYRGMKTALHGGANAVRVPFDDPDGLDWPDAGVTITEAQKRNGVAWSNGKPFTNGSNWHCSRPAVAVAAAAALGDTTISLEDEHWGHSLFGGERIGFFPFHFGLYEVTEVIEPGEYRIWPPLRKALTTSSYSTLNPVMAMRLESETSAKSPRGNLAVEAATMTLVEVQDSDVRDYFAD